MKNNNILRIVLSVILVASSMLIILRFSLQDGVKSGEISSDVIKDVLDVVIGEENVTEEMVVYAQIPVRKLAHFGVYMLLGFTLINLFYLIYSFINYKLFFAFPLLIGVLYSIFDEHLIQRITSGRAPSWIDVLIDSVGLIIGICLYILLIIVTNRIKNNRQRI